VLRERWLAAIITYHAPFRNEVQLAEFRHVTARNRRFTDLEKGWTIANLPILPIFWKKFCSAAYFLRPVRAFTSANAQRMNLNALEEPISGSQSAATSSAF
jgi:hypothetical protein